MTTTQTEATTTPQPAEPTVSETGHGDTLAERSTPKAPRKPRAAKTAPAKTTPAKAAAKPKPAPAPKPTPAPKINKFAGKQELSRLCILALDALIAGLTKEQLAEIGMSRDEAAKVTANRIHHFGTGGEWPAKTMPKPDRSDWR